MARQVLWKFHALAGTALDGKEVCARGSICCCHMVLPQSWACSNDQLQTSESRNAPPSLVDLRRAWWRQT